MKNYILDENGVPVVEPDLGTWLNWFQKADRRVKQEWIGNTLVSTVFLGTDQRCVSVSDAIRHAYDDSPPLLWETMVFHGSLDQYQERCSGTRKDAEEMHARVVARVKESQTVQ